MRPQQTEVNLRGGRGRSRHESRRLNDRKAARRMALESLESRILMAVLPPPTLSAPVDITNRVGAEYDPQVAVDPTNPLRAVVIYNGVIAPPTVQPGPVSYVAAAATTDGGKNWTPFTMPAARLDPTTSNPEVPYGQLYGVDVQFDRNGTFYVLEQETGGAATAAIETGNPLGNSGAIVVTRFNFAGGTPTQVSSTQVYQWVGADQATLPVLAVDNNVATFNDTLDSGAAASNSDPFAGNVYVAVISNDTPQAGNPLAPNFNPNRVELFASSDKALSFTGPITINGPANGPTTQRNTSVSLAVSQGSVDGRVPGGQVNLVWADTGSLATANPPTTQVLFSPVSGGLGLTFPVTNAGPITDAFDPGNSAPHIPGVTDFQIPINITDPRFISLTDLKVKLDMIHPNLNEVTLTLIPPAGSGLSPFTLVQAQTDPANNTNTGRGVSGANLGVITVNNFVVPNGAVGTVFDDSAARDIVDINPFTGARGAGAPFIGHFRPEGAGFGLGASLDSTFGGATAAQINGTWILRVTDNRQDTNAIQFLVDATLEINSGLVDSTDTTAAFPLRNIASPTNAPTSLITTSPVIASDNTLGAFSQFQGRLYVAYVDRVNANGNPADNGDIMLVTSDNNGLSWSFPIQVNDDNALTDGFSSANDGLSGTGRVFGRPQYEPQVEVDQSTGTVALAWLDMRYDASRNRSVYELATSIDGGQTFSKNEYTNISQTAKDGITNQTVTIAPITDNFTTNATPTNIVLSSGLRQGLAIGGGHIYPVWSSNQNKANTNGSIDPLVDVYVNPAVTADGPRIIASTMGPVGQPGDTLNATRAQDGSPQASAFVITFDRPVDPSTFTVQSIQVIFHDTTAGNTTGSQIPVIDVVPINLGFFGPARAHGATQFRVDFAPRSNVGTYSYTIAPDIKDRIRSVGFTLTPVGTTTIAAVAPQVPKNIAAPSTTTSTIPVAGIPAGQVVTKATVNLTLSYPFTGDLRLSLIAPDGTSVLLANQEPFQFGGFGQGFINTTFDDGANRSIADPQQGPPYTGSFQPEQSLAGFVNHAPNGAWQLQIVDVFPFGGVSGTLQNWSLTLQTGTVSFAANTGNKMDQNSNAKSGELPVAPASGNIWTNDVYAAPNPLDGVRLDPSDPTGKTYLITGPLDQDTLPLIVPGPHIVSTSVPNLAPPTLYVAPANQVNKPIPTNGAPLNSAITVSNLNGRSVSKLTVNLSIADTADGPLILALFAPDGTRIPLSIQRGGAGANFTNTTFSDQAGTAISAGAAPFSGSFRPETPLANLNGKDPQGVWTLQAINLSSGNVATLLGWSLTITTTNTAASDNLVLDNTVSGLDVTFDRNMTPSSLTPTQILQIMGPSGPVVKPYTYPSTTGSQAIPVGANGPLISSFFVNDDGTFQISRLNVNLNITHPQDANLTIVLVGPDGTQATLVSGVSGANFTNTTFGDQSLVPIGSGAAPFTGLFKPIQALAAFNGKQIKGFWKLEVFDNSATPSGTLTSWSLLATPAVTITPNPSGSDPNPSFPKTYRVSFPTQQLSGTYVVQFSPSILDENGNAIDANQNAGVDLVKGSSTAGTGATTPLTYNSTDVPHTIPTLRSVTSILTIPDNFVISDVSLKLNITFPNDPDLSATLIAPDGTPIQLFTNLAATGNHQNFSNTLFNDNAPTPIQNGGSPYFSTTGFKPQQSLDNVLGGRLSAGTYTLVITNASSTNIGTLNSWSLILFKPVLSSGLGEAVADRSSESFRIFTMDPTNPLSSDTWTAIGPASIVPASTPGTGPESESGGRSGRVTGLAVDPSDPSGNTVYVGGATGGIWKTTNFLSPEGPTYIPLTQFGPTFAINIGGIAVFGRNSDPNQSIVIAATGEGDTGGGYISNGAGVSSPGVGFLRSMDGGQNWELLDSKDNTLPFAQRDHFFSKNGGTLSFQIVVDPTPTLSGGVIVYAAISGNNGGIWRSLDSGMHWTNMLPGQATSVVLDFSSGTGVNGGNLQNVFAGIQGVGIFSSTNEGQTWNLMGGQVGDPLIIDTTRPPVTPVGVGNRPALPNPTPNAIQGGGLGRIVLAKPTPPPGSSAAEVLNLQGWLYAAVVTDTGDFVSPPGQTVGLWMTKDFGQNWVHVHLGNQPLINGVQQATPTNDITINTGEYDLTGNPTTGLAAQGNYDLSLGVDPTNPNIAYVGGSEDFGPTGFVRVDTTFIHDAHALIAYSAVGPDGGLLQVNSNISGSVVVDDNTKAAPQYLFLDPRTGFLTPEGPFINLIHDPLQPFLNDATLFTINANRFTNDGSGATWTPFDLGGTDQHRIVTTIDPLTGHSRIIIADDQGVFSAVDNNGVLSDGIGTAPFADGSRNGNLQITQFYYGAVQPSNAAAQIAFDQSQGQVGSSFPGGMFYGSSQDDGGPISDPNTLTNGNLGWAGPGGDGGGVAVDQQGNGTLLQYWWPCCGGNFTDFFQVNGAGRTFGLLQQSNPGVTPDPQWSFAFPNNIAINPLNASQVLISSNAGRIFRTENQGLFWSDIGDPAPPSGTPALDGTLAAALAFGAPDPNSPSGVGNLDNFLYAGTVAGHIFVSQSGGGTPGQGNAWINVSAGLDGSAVQHIITNPLRGSHQAWAVTLRGVYFMADSLAAGATWRNITANLFQITRAAFGDPTQILPELSYLTSIQADWRYTIPDNPAQPNGPTHPVLYVGGEGGVYRSLDEGLTWTSFPGTATSGTPTPPGEGGGIPVSHVSDLTSSTGNIDPSTGRAVATAGDPNVLMASTYGTGAYAIRLAPIILTDTAFLHLDGVLPAPGGSDSGIISNDNITNVLQPVIDGLSEQTAFGTTVTVNLLDLTPLFPGGPLRDAASAPVIGTATTDSAGHFQVQVIPGYFLPQVTDGVKTLGIQAVDQSGTKGNLALMVVTIDTTPPVTPNAPKLSATTPPPIGSDSGVSQTDGITNIRNPSFDVTNAEPTGILNLFRDNQIVATITRTIAGSSTVTLTDPGPVTDGTHLYKVQAIDLAGNVSPFSLTTAVTIDTAPPNRPNAPVLDPADDSGALGDNITNVNRPRFDGTAEPNGIIQLLDSARNVVGTAVVSPQGTYSVAGGNALRPTTVLADGTYTFTVVSEDVAGNFSVQSLPFTITIKTQTPTTPTLSVVPADITGPTTPIIITNNKQPRLQGTATPGLNVQIIDVGGNITGTAGNIVPMQPPPAVVDSSGKFLVRFLNQLPDGTYTVKARVFDSAGNFSDSLPLSLKILTKASPVATTLVLAPASTYGLAANHTTFQRRPLFTGTATFTTPPVSPAANVIIKLINFATNAVLATTTTDSQGKFSVTLASDLNNGTISLVVRYQDNAGNLGDASTPPLTVKVVTAPGDYDNDGKADLALYRPTTDQWFISQSAAGLRGQSAFGVAGSVPLQGDFDGDGKIDFAEFDPTTAKWYILRSRSGPETLQFGQAGVDIPVPEDYDGDGVTDLAVYRPTTGQWFILQSQAGPKITNISSLAAQPGDVPIPGDYSGDGKADLAMFRPSTATWYTPLQTKQFGTPNVDVPVPADFDADGKTDIAVFRPSFTVGSQDQWVVILSAGGAKVQNLGGPGDIPVPQDYDGDGKADLATFRPNSVAAAGGNWSILQSASNDALRTAAFGAGTDRPDEAPYSFRAGRGTRSSFRSGAADMAGAATGQGSGGLNFGATASNFVAPPINPKSASASVLNLGSSNGTTASSPTSSGRAATTAAHSRRHVVNVGHESTQTPAETAAHYLRGVRDEILAHALNGVRMPRRRR
jgi:subtilisin-like proprotein convertase family protein